MRIESSLTSLPAVDILPPPAPPHKEVKSSVEAIVFTFNINKY